MGVKVKKGEMGPTLALNFSHLKSPADKHSSPIITTCIRATSDNQTKK